MITFDTIETATIDRHRFVQSIEAGIHAAEHLLTQDGIDRLKEIGRTAKMVGSNYGGPGGLGCPATLAGLYDSQVFVGEPAFLVFHTFAIAYDDALKIYGSDPGPRLIFISDDNA